MKNTLLTPQTPTDRVGRYPKHTFNRQATAFVVTPVMFARVLPGETLQNLFMEARAVTDPVKNSIIGWKKEYHFYYIRITDLLNDAMKAMFVDPANQEISTNVAAGNDRPFYTAKGGIQYLRVAYDRVIASYYRDHGEDPNSHRMPNGLAFGQIREQTFMDSLTDVADMPEGADVADATSIADLERLMDAFEQLRALGIANMTYEDWLRTNGIAIPKKDENEPEMIARFSEFMYPSNTINPVDGAPTSALSWVFKNGQRSPKFFKEPGFILGVTITRPKVYYGALAGGAAGFAKRSWDWLPNYLRHMPETALKSFASGTGPLGDYAVDVPEYFLDMRDELLYGDQMLSSAPSETTADYNSHSLPLPRRDLSYKYPTEAEAKGFFKSNDAAYIREDGYVSLNVKGFEVDYTKGNLAQL